MQAMSILKYAGLSVQKTRLVADLIRGMPVGQAVQVLKFSNKKAADTVIKALSSAIANAEHNLGADIDELKCRNDLCRSRTAFETHAYPCSRSW